MKLVKKKIKINMIQNLKSNHLVLKIKYKLNKEILSNFQVHIIKLKILINNILNKFNFFLKGLVCQHIT